MPWLVLVVGLASTACDESSPTSPGPPQTTAQVVIVDPAGAFTAHHATLRQIVSTTLDQSLGVLSAGGVTATVFADPTRAIPGWGLGGYAPDAATIEIVVDPEYPGLGGILFDRLPPIVAHEAHHTVRWRGPGYGSTLLESMVSEGLADHFAEELLGGPRLPWTEAFPPSETERYLALARPELDRASFDFGRWFFGTRDLPNWTGYTLGYRLVAAYQADHPGASAADLVDAPADLFRPTFARP